MVRGPHGRRAFCFLGNGAGAMKKVLTGVAMAVALAGAGQAQDAALADVGLQARMDALSSDTAAVHGFELGLLGALRSIERTLQTRYEYGMGDGLRTMPVLRLELGPRNPNPKAPTAQTLSDIMRNVLGDLETARGYLNQAAETDAITPFRLTVQDIWFDVNANGSRDAGEDVIDALGPILLGPWVMREMGRNGALEEPITVRFDAADHAWLTAYTHMLSGIGNLFLAFDPAPVLQDMTDKRAMLSDAPQIENTFDSVALNAEIDALRRQVVSLQARMDLLRAREDVLSQKARDLRSAEPRDEGALKAANQDLRQLRAEKIRPLRTEIRSLRADIAATRAKLAPSEGGARFEGFRTDIDAFYVLLAALRQQPDAERIAATRAHWLSMIAHNKVFWAALSQETDNVEEWVPNPQQTSALELRVDEDMAQGWQDILEDAENLLEGRLLLPHPLLPAGTGISLKAYADNPGPLDVLDWVHGIGAYGYAAKGPMISAQRWRAFQRLTGGNAGGFALFFN